VDSRTDLVARELVGRRQRLPRLAEARVVGEKHATLRVEFT
jgi:hypothetical protein